MNHQLSDRVKRVSQLDIVGGGQVVVQGNYAYVGHMKPPFGTSIIDVSNPSHPRVVCSLDTGSEWSHTHKVRVAGDLMITNVEQDRRHLLRKGDRLGAISDKLLAQGIAQPSPQQLAEGLGVSQSDLSAIQAFHKRGYDEGGFKVWDISDPTQPQLLCYQRTHGFGVHRFDMDEHYAYISTEAEGFVGNILIIYDLADPTAPREIARWWMPGQHIAGGETPGWEGYGHRLHHALRVGNELWAAVWHAGFRVIDISDISKPQTIGSYNYHPWVVEPTHTVLPATQTIDGRRIAVVCDEEHAHRHGQPHAGLWLFDVTDVKNIQPLSTFHVSELDSPWSRAEGRFGIHQFQEHIDDHLVYCAWFSGGLRIVDISDPTAPQEAGFFIPEPVGTEPAPQSNDLDVDERGLIYLLDRNRGLDILEYQPHT